MEEKCLYYFERISNNLPLCLVSRINLALMFRDKYPLYIYKLLKADKNPLINFLMKGGGNRVLRSAVANRPVSFYLV